MCSGDTVGCVVETLLCPMDIPLQLMPCAPMDAICAHICVCACLNALGWEYDKLCTQRDM